MIDKNLMDVLVCPKCESEVREKGDFLICNKCELAYPILDKTIPDMLIKDAIKLKDSKKLGFKHNLVI